MTYLDFLALFLGLPIAALGALAWWDARRGRAALAGRRAAVAVLAHVAVAVAYTTPWDNYLVATGVWWYDPTRVLGVTLGWVPLEEYLFFMLQPVATGLLLLALARRLPARGPGTRPRLRVWSAAGVLVTWLASLLLLASGWQLGTYLGLELAWALPPLALQLAVGADILWRHRRRVLTALAVATLYLCAADALAIGAGIWTIDPRQSLPWLIGGVLPVEEFTFFLLTNTLVTFGLTLSLAPETGERWARLRALVAQRSTASESA
jgi:lycopene cyclase domain-containing protein